MFFGDMFKKRKNGKKDGDSFSFPFNAFRNMDIDSNEHDNNNEQEDLFSQFMNYSFKSSLVKG